jgi:CubicO group peptidase (beta-lactamase class C family)
MTAMTALNRSTPSAQATDARGVIAFLDALDALGSSDALGGASQSEPHGVMLLRHGHVIAEGWWAPYTPERLHQLYSLSKIFTSTAAGLARAEGLLDLDAPVIDYFPELDGEVTDPRSRSILVRHIASMSAGHTGEQWDRALDTDWDEPVRGFLLDPPDGTPGVTFAYSQSTTYTLGAIIQRQSGQSLAEYLRPRIFEPLGIGEVFWRQHPKGRDLAFADLHGTTEAVARLGQLYLRGGVWEGRRLLSAEWVAEATRTQVDNAGAGDPASDWTQGYGYQFWMSRHGYRGDGAYGQYCVVLPEQDVVLAMTTESRDMQAVLEAAWTHLLPAFDREGSAEADEALNQRLTGLQLPFPDGLDGEDVPAGEFTASRSVLHRLQRISLTPQTLTLHETDGTSTTLPLTPGAWPPPAGHLSARAARTEADKVIVHLQFTMTPHKLVLTCDPRSGTFDADWRTVPLGPVAELPLSAIADPRAR